MALRAVSALYARPLVYGAVPHTGPRLQARWAGTVARSRTRQLRKVVTRPGGEKQKEEQEEEEQDGFISRTIKRLFGRKTTTTAKEDVNLKTKTARIPEEPTTGGIAPGAAAAALGVEEVRSEARITTRGIYKDGRPEQWRVKAMEKYWTLAERRVLADYKREHSATAYIVPDDVNASVRDIASLYWGADFKDSDAFPSLAVKFQVLDKACATFGRDIPNPKLPELRTLADVISFFSEAPVMRHTPSLFKIDTSNPPPNLIFTEGPPKGFLDLDWLDEGAQDYLDIDSKLPSYKRKAIAEA
eukprot:Opistho-1_new@1200